MNKPNEYQCAKCFGIFQFGWSEEECKKEKEELWGNIPMAECARICDDCFKEIDPRKHPINRFISTLNFEE